MSGKVGAKSQWLRSKLARGKISLDLIRVKDMTVFKEVGTVDAYRDLGPAQRLAQKGSDACKGLLLGALSVGSLPGVKARDIILVVDMQPAISNQWAVAVADVQKSWNLEGLTPKTFYFGVCREKGVYPKLVADMADQFMRGWWPLQPAAQRSRQDPSGKCRRMRRRRM